MPNAPHATVSVEVSGVEPFKNLVEAVLAYREALEDPEGMTITKAIRADAMFAALDALNEDERLWHEEHPDA